MIKKYIYILIIILFSVDAFAQNYGNEWINYNQSYYKFPIVKDGIYRISYSQLQSAGVPLQNINNPKNMQIFGRGKEIHIYVKNENTGVFTPSDYIEFYAQHNDGWYDSALYQNPNQQPNTSYSLFTDTAFYYFTWNNSYNNARLTISNDINYSTYSESNYFLFDSKLFFKSEYMDGEKEKYFNDFIADPEYVNGEGWYDNAIKIGQTRTRNLPTKNVYTSGPYTKVFLEVMGGSSYGTSGTNVPNHHFQVTYANKTIDTLFNGYTRVILSDSVLSSNLGNNNTSFVMKSVNDINVNADRVAVPYLRMIYPHSPNLENKNEFKIICKDAVNQSKTYFNFSNFNGGSDPVFYDLYNNIRIKVTKNASNYQVLVPNSGGEKKCFISSSNNIHSVIGMMAVSPNAKFHNYITENPNADYIIISNPLLMGSNSNYATANDYAAYRNLTGFNTLLVNINDLYDQYCYGIHKNPMSIRNFIIQLGSTYSYSQFKGIFIIGKSFRATEYRKKNTSYNGTLIPTMGSPPSDNLFVSGLIDTLYQQAIPIGRLSAKTLDDVDLYLDKMKIYEDRNQNPYDMWMKNIMHFSGGSNATEQHNFSTYLNSYKRIVEDTLFGANVFTIYKSSSDPIQINMSELIKRKVNNGVSLMTFFGHAAGIGFDISIDNPDEYENYGKYPILLANSCFAGDIFQTTDVNSVNSSEAFVLIRNKGMIAYIASITSAYGNQLNYFSKDFYKLFSTSNYNEYIGKVIKNTVANIQNNTIQRKEVCLEMTLHGDPVLKINSAPLPDYFLDSKSVFYNPQIVSTATDSFDYKLIIANKGKAINDTLLVEITRQYPTMDSVDRYVYRIKAPLYIDTLTVKMPVNRANGIGNNIISVNLDSYGAINELDKTNNYLSSILNIKAADISPVYPPKFAIISSQSNIRLRASTYYPFTQSLDYIFQIDTTDYFNSPLKLTKKITSSGGVIEYSPAIVLNDSTVYYWRVSLDSNSNNNYNWRNSSFQYIQNQSGWSQAHFLQFRNNQYQFTKFKEDARTYEFVNDISLLKGQTGIYPYVPWTEIYLKIDNGINAQWSCIPYQVGGIKYFVFDKISAKITPSIGNGWGITNYGSIHCRPYNVDAVEFPTGTTNLTANGLGIIQDTTWFRNAANFLDQVQDGDMVMAMSFGNAHPSTWPEYLYKAYDTIGSAYIRNYPDNRPFIIYGKKGSMGGAHEEVASNMTDLLIFKDSIITHWNEGKVKSPIIGPSKKWSSLNWKQHSLDIINTDSVLLKLYGIKVDGTKDLLISGITPDSSEVILLNDIMPADIYPYCQLECVMQDDSFRTPAYIDYWNIKYQTAPEVAIDPLTHYKFHSDTLMQGDSLHLELAYRNISDVDMDSLLVRVWVKDPLRRIHQISERRLSPLRKQSSIIDTIVVSTADWIGQCYLYVEINPINTETQSYDQIEISHFNNSGDIPFFVLRDKENPLLDVTFDGIHILDGDIVSATPEITISLRDESKFMAINDTSLFKVRIKKSTDNDFKDVYFSNIDNVLEFIPAKLPDNSANVIYRPKLEDGEYQLLIYANDASYNKSGDNGYKIDFVIINKTSITNLLNWPNPFSDKTHFVFTLTGSVLPDYMKIQIMTVTGKVVREIDMNELGALHIGRNITDYAWDGKDEYGDQLANGVYLYRVVTRINGETIEHRETSADKYFKKSFGKMYLMR